MSRLDKIKAEEKFPILEQSYIIGKILDGTTANTSFYVQNT